MAIKTYNPITPGMRHVVLVDKTCLYKGKPCKKLTHGFAKTGGRNNRGVITSRGIGGGCRRKYREINFCLSKTHGNAKVLRIEQDPNRTAFIALIEFENGKLNYILATDGIKSEDLIAIGDSVEIKAGNSMPLKNIPIGFNVHSVELKPRAGSQIARSAGGYATVLGKNGNKVLIRLRSGESMYLDGDCYATIGIVSNLDQRNVSLGKAGRARLMGRKPKVRGVAMNPIDHPHGGGEGKTGTGGPPKSPWGKLTKGAKTVKKKKKKKGGLL